MISAILMNVATKKDHDGEAIVPHILLQLLTYFLPLCPHYCLVSAFIRYGGGVYQNHLCKVCAKPICQGKGNGATKTLKSSSLCVCNTVLVG